MAVTKRTMKRNTLPVPLTDEMRKGLEELREETGLSLAAIARLAVKEYLHKNDKQA